MPNLFPIETIPAPSENQSSQIKFGRSWRFDFEKGDFITTPTGKVATADELEAYIQWCQKALLTPRYRHLIYTRNYGSEFEDLIGRGLPREVIESEIKRMATEALMVNPRTAEVGNFVFDWQNDVVFFTCEIITAWGETGKVGTKVVMS